MRNSFRGRNSDNKWVYGDLKHVGNNVYVANELVDSQTVGQSTGMFDCQGKEVYEHDIIRSYETNRNRLVFVGEVTFKNGAYRVVCGTQLELGVLVALEIYDAEVCGNTIDNKMHLGVTNIIK